MVRQTSLFSYHELLLENPQRVVALRDAILAVLRANPSGLSDSEIIKLLPRSYDILEPRVRRYELYKKGKVAIRGKKVCSVTGKKVLTWGIKR